MEERPMQTTKEKVSYCIGLETGKNLKQQFADMDFKFLSEGFHDALKDMPPQLAKEEIQSILVALKNQIETQQRQHFTRISEENKQRGEAFLAENKEKEGVITLQSGLQYKVLSSGPGKGPHPTPLDVVKIHYRGSFIDGRVFDSSYQRGQPVSFPLNRVITGWSEAVQKMKVGDKWQVVIPSYLAYAEMGYGQEIGPNSTLIFEIELLGINES
jgi:FKBP-type peptidyl-prolyl cis-trans isomerase FklB